MAGIVVNINNLMFIALNVSALSTDMNFLLQHSRTAHALERYLCGWQQCEKLGAVVRLWIQEPPLIAGISNLSPRPVDLRAVQLDVHLGTPCHFGLDPNAVGCVSRSTATAEHAGTHHTPG